MNKKNAYNYIDYYLTEIQAKGRYSVTLDELRNRFSTSEKAILQNIYRLKRKNQLAQVRKEFYVVVPPQYSNRGMVPPTLFIGDLMQFLNHDYYVSLLSASAMHGAGHQQPMQFQVIIKKPPLRSIKNEKLNINFFVKSKWLDENIVQKKTETGYINVSSPAQTAFDLIHYNKKIGGINRVIPILEELVENIKVTEMSATAKAQKTPDIQRLGFLLDCMGFEKLASTLQTKVNKKQLQEIPISLAHKNREGELNHKWSVILNTELDC